VMTARTSDEDDVFELADLHARWREGAAPHDERKQAYPQKLVDLMS
jgi:hypothetical protein